MNVLGDMVYKTGYPVMIVIAIMVTITIVEMEATVMPKVVAVDMMCCFFIFDCAK